MEVCLNLYYVFDDDGLIYSLRVHPYALEGSDEPKLPFLRERAALDYLVARSFEIPEQFHLRVDGRIYPDAHAVVLETSGRLARFEEAIQQTASGLPAQSPITVPENPIVCITPLHADNDGNIEPIISGTEILGWADPNEQAGGQDDEERCSPEPATTSRILDSEGEYGNAPGSDRYILSARDEKIVAAAKLLLRKMACVPSILPV